MNPTREARDLVNSALRHVLLAWGSRGPLDAREGDPEQLLEAAAQLQTALDLLGDALKGEDPVDARTEISELAGALSTRGRPQ